MSDSAFGSRGRTAASGRGEPYTVDELSGVPELDSKCTLGTRAYGRGVIPVGGCEPSARWYASSTDAGKPVGRISFGGRYLE